MLILSQEELDNVFNRPPETSDGLENLKENEITYGLQNKQLQEAKTEYVSSQKSESNLTTEDKFYEKLGIKYYDSNMFGVYSRMKGRALLLLVAIVGYVAYKKFNK